MPTGTLTVFLVCPEFPPVQTGGGAYVYGYLARELSKHCRVVTLAADYTQTTIKHGSDGNLITIPIPLLRPGGKSPELITRTPPTAGALRRMMRVALDARHVRKTGRPVANLHGLGHPVVDIAGFLFWCAGIPYVLTVHGFPGSHSTSFASTLYQAYDRIITRWVLKHATAVISISADVQRLLLTRGIESHVVANAIDVQADIAQHGVPSGGRTQLLCVGRLAADKGFQYAIQALDKLAGVKPELSLLILGDDFGAEADLIRSVPETIRSRVVFGGRVDRNTVLREMEKALAVIIPSLDEPFGLVALEALSVGAVVIASRSGALPEIIRHEADGLLVEPRSGDGIAAAVLRVLGDGTLERTLRCNAPKRAGSFSTEAAAARYLEIFDHALSSHYLDGIAGTRSSPQNSV